MPDEQAHVQRQMFDDEHTPPRKKRDKRHRFQYRFWIDANKDDELLLGEELEALKSKRQFQPTIRKAVRLFLDLRNKKIDVLLKLFPWVEDAIEERIAERRARFDTPATTEFMQILQQQAQILERMAERSPIPATSSRAGVNVPEIDLSASIFADDAGPVERGNLAANMGDLFADDDDDDLFDD